MIDYSPLLLSFRLALVSTLVLIIVATPIAWWLARTKNIIKPWVEAVVALPLVLPPTVLGFYLLVLLSPKGFFGQTWVQLTGTSLTFSFIGLVIASIFYSFPFVVQAIQQAFENVSEKLLEAAASLGAKPLDVFLNVVLPLSKRGFLTAFIMGFAHTLGEFGVVLMVGGNIAGETRVVSIAIYDHVERMEYSQAHQLSLILLGLAFTAMLLMFVFNKKRQSV